MDTISRRNNRSSDAEYDMMWVQTTSGRRCGECEVVVECWVLHNDAGRRVAEATFCPVCYPDLERIFHPCEQAPNAA